MNKIYLITLFIFSFSHAVTTSFYFKTEELTPGVTQLSRINVYSDRINYVSGGITINYPTNFFAEEPTVKITTQLNGQSYATSLIFGIAITANSATSTSIRVNKSLLGLVLGALTNDVTLHIVAEAPAP